MLRVAERMRREALSRLRGMTPAARLLEALSLGREMIAVHAAAHGIEPEQARRRLERAAQAGRRRSRVMLEIIG
jgi:hypothetical protein